MAALRGTRPPGDLPRANLPKGQTGFRELDLRIAICLGMGLSHRGTAEIAPCDASTIGDRKRINSEFIEAWRAFTEKVAKHIEESETEVTKENALVRQERFLGKTEKLIDKVLRMGLEEGADIHKIKEAMKAVRIVFDRQYGLPTAELKVSSEHTEVHEIGPATLALLERVRQRAALIEGPVRDEGVIDVDSE